MMKYPILALLAKEPAHGYELKQAFEDLFRPVYPSLNAGQIYSTLSRLERDALVQDHHVAQESRPDKRVYRLTPLGLEALKSWLEGPITGPRLKDEFFTKLVLARLANVGDSGQLIDRQRQEYLQDLRDLNDLAMKLDARGNQVTLLLINGAILHLKADLEWLDMCEEQFS